MAANNYIITSETNFLFNCHHIEINDFIYFNFALFSSNCAHLSMDLFVNHIYICMLKCTHNNKHDRGRGGGCTPQDCPSFRAHQKIRGHIMGKAVSPEPAGYLFQLIINKDFKVISVIFPIYSRSIIRKHEFS
jgi:hypothetical protein